MFWRVFRRVYNVAKAGYHNDRRIRALGLYLFSESVASHIGHGPVRYDEVVGFFTSSAI